MRSICKKSSVMFVAVLALCAIASASASAAQWYVNGSALKGSAALSQTINLEEEVKISLYSKEKLEQTYGCTSLTDPGKAYEIVAPSTLKVGDFLLNKCTMTYPVLKEECKVNEGIGTSPLTTTFTDGTSPEDHGQFTTVEEGGFWTAFEPKGCLLENGPITVYGTLAVKLPHGQTASTEQELVFEKAPGLYAYENTSEPVYITGKAKLKLASGDTWNLR
jgi:hypothetical protein